MAAEDAGRTQAYRPGGLDVGLIAQGHHVPAHDLGDLAEADHRETDDKGDVAPLDADGKDDQHGQNQTWDGGQKARQGGDAPVKEAARPPAGDGAQQQSQQQAEHRGKKGQDERRPGAIEQQREQVPAQVIGAQAKGVAGQKWRSVELAVDPLDRLDQVRVVRGHFGAQNGDQYDERDQDRAQDKVGFADGPPQSLPKGERFHWTPAVTVLSRGSRTGYSSSRMAFTMTKSSARVTIMPTAPTASPT